MVVVIEPLIATITNFSYEKLKKKFKKKTWLSPLAFQKSFVLFALINDHHQTKQNSN